MKNIYFFGCSFTAGDELSDEEYFPWKFTENHTPETYYQKRNVFFEKNYNKWNDYVKSNKEKSYPLKINSAYQIHNQSSCGRALRHNIFDVIKLLESDHTVDALYFQIPPVGRETYIDKDAIIQSITMSILKKTDEHFAYLRIKAKTHDYKQYSLDDLLDLIMLREYLNNKNIYYKFLDFFDLLNVRINDVIELQDKHSVYKEIIDSASRLPTIKFNFGIQDMLLGGHLTIEGHETVAKRLEIDLRENLI